MKNLCLLPLLIAELGLILTGRVTAQTFTTLYSFTATDPNNYANSDGAFPAAGLILSGNTLYGTATHGGSSGWGTVFAVNTDGVGFTTLCSFTGVDDGAFPSAGLILSENTLYGAARDGGNSFDGTVGYGSGAVFAVNTDGTAFSHLYTFTAPSQDSTGHLPNSDGAFPQAGLILSDNTLYGTAVEGGSSGSGTVFKLNTDGTGFTTLHSFTLLSFQGNGDGGELTAGLILSGSTLFGTASFGGSSSHGTVFAINTNGTGFRILHSFTGVNNGLYYTTNSDGAHPQAGLILSGDTLYGTTSTGGSGGNGTVFAVNTNGTGFTNLHSFAAGFGSDRNVTNSEGAFPFAGLILSGNTLYGTARGGGSSGNGTVFAINTDGTGFTTLHSFTTFSGATGFTNSDGALPRAGLILSGNSLYGTTSQGGSSGSGTVFSLSVPPRLTMIHSGANVILTWPTNATGFTLQSAMNLVSPAVWATVSPGPVVADGQNAVTNPISGTQQFFRLSQ